MQKRDDATTGSHGHVETPESNAPQDSPGRIIVFTSNGTNRWVHLYDTPEQIAKDNVEGSPAGVVEFFDTEGRRLLPRFGPDWKLTGLALADGKPEKDRVRDRLLAVLRERDKLLNEQTAERRKELTTKLATQPSANGHGAPFSLTDSTTLDAAYETLTAEEFGHPPRGRGATGEPDLGSAWHNFWAHGIV